jgi:hypothetical protein
VRNANTPWNARSRATTDWRRPLLERHFAFWHGRCFFTLGWYKEFERATMTRIGRCQIEARHLTGNASSRRDNLAPLKIFQAKLRRSISVCRRRSAVTQQSLIHKLFLKSHSVGRIAGSLPFNETLILLCHCCVERKKKNPPRAALGDNR